MPIRAVPATRMLLVIVLALSTAIGSSLPLPAFADEYNGAIHGVVYQADEKSKLAGAKVTAINVLTRKQYVSNVTEDNGDFEIRGLPPGTYDLAIEVGVGLFVADNLIDLSQNQHLSVSYSVQPLRPANRKLAGMPMPKGSATPIGSGPGTGAASGRLAGGGRTFWGSPGGITLITALAVGAGLAINNHRGDHNGSPSTP
jgi:carboxypeptidase family protein